MLETPTLRTLIFCLPICSHPSFSFSSSFSQFFSSLYVEGGGRKGVNLGAREIGNTEEEITLLTETVLMNNRSDHQAASTSPWCHVIISSRFLSTTQHSVILGGIYCKSLTTHNFVSKFLITKHLNQNDFLVQIPAFL
jgi:hypothetical protein